MCPWLGDLNISFISKTCCCVLLPNQIGPEKGVVHLATAAILNAVWDLWAKQEGKVTHRRSTWGALWNNSTRGTGVNTSSMSSLLETKDIHSRPPKEIQRIV